MVEARAQPLSSQRPVPEVGSISASLLELHCLALLCGPSLGAPALSCYLGLACETRTHPPTHPPTHTHTCAHTPPLHPWGHLWIMQENQSLPDPTPCFPESGRPSPELPRGERLRWGRAGESGPVGSGREAGGTVAAELALLQVSEPPFSSGKQYHWLRLCGRGSGFFLPSPNPVRGEVTAKVPVWW